MRSLRLRLATSSTVSPRSWDQASGAHSANTIAGRTDRNLRGAISGLVDAIMPSAMCRAGGPGLVRSGSGTALQALKIGGGVGRCLVALCPPDRLGEAFDRLVQRRMALAAARHQAAKPRHDAGWLVDGELLFQRH